MPTGRSCAARRRALATLLENLNREVGRRLQKIVQVYTSIEQHVPSEAGCYADLREATDTLDLTTRTFARDIRTHLPKEYQ